MSIFTRTRRASVTRYNPETISLRDNIVAHAGTISAASLLSADAFVTSTKASGVWPKLLDVGLFVGDQLNAALVKLISASGAPAMTNVGFLNGDYTERGAGGGLTNTGAKYLRLGTLANQTGSGSDAGSQSGALSVYVNNLDAGGVLIGAQAADANSYTTLTQNPTNIQFGWGGGDPMINDNIISASGLITGVAGQDLQGRIYGNAALQATAAIPGAFAGSADEFYFFAENNNGAHQNSWNGQASFYAIATVLTPADVANLYAAVQQLQIALNRNV